MVVVVVVAVVIVVGTLAQLAQCLALANTHRHYSLTPSRPWWTLLLLLLPPLLIKFTNCAVQRV